MTDQNFTDTVTSFYEKNGRHLLPWRKTCNPYHILVSEVMLQQTQVDRVIPKYKYFLSRFPSFELLADASLQEVLLLWQGLGYNRRAKMLHQCAKDVVKSYEGKLPHQEEQLLLLPGIGPYTASAICAFAYNKPVVMIETNIRTVFLYHFFSEKNNVDDADIIPYIRSTVDINNPRQWYWALMDYGAYLKKKHGNLNKKSKHYLKQSAFKGSDREIRGAIIRVLVNSKKYQSKKQLFSRLKGFDKDRLTAQLDKLIHEGMIEAIKDKFRLPS